MALPKKGTRQIVVDDETYRYQVRFNCSRSRMLTVEPPVGKIRQQVFMTDKVTPKDIEQYIRKEVW
jgi:hypothetical protein